MVTCSPERFMWMYESMGKISNITNSSDPQMINSRVFCGNLNTFTLTKDDVEAIFKRYGRIIGISMHKGYAFVQYTNEYDARNAVAGEDQRIYAGQPVDVNMASEPKPNRPSRKRPQGAGSEWDYYYNARTVPQTNLSPTLHPGPGLAHRGDQVAPPFLKRPHPELLELDDFTPVVPRGLIPPPMKRLRPEHIPPIKMPGHLKRNLVPLPGSAAAAAAMMKGRLLVPRLRMGKVKAGIPIRMVPRPSELGEYESPDILICGNCKQTFSDLDKLLSHKQAKCKLRFLCRCNEDSIKHLAELKNGDPTSLSCATCHSAFSSGWELCQHVQAEHGLQIYVLPNTNNSENSTSSKDGAESTSDDKEAIQIQNINDGETGSTDLALEGEGDIVAITQDGTALIFADDDDIADENDVTAVEVEGDAAVASAICSQDADAVDAGDDKDAASTPSSHTMPCVDIAE